MARRVGVEGGEAAAGGGGRRGPGGRRPRSSEARGAGKPREGGGGGGGAGPGWQLQGSPAARAGGRRREREPVPASPQPARRVRGLFPPPTPPRSLAGREGSTGVRWGEGVGEGGSTPRPPAVHVQLSEEGGPRHQCWPLWRLRSRGSYPPPPRLVVCPGRDRTSIPGSGSMLAFLASLFLPLPSSGASTLGPEPPRAGSRPGPCALLALLANYKSPWLSEN